MRIKVLFFGAAGDIVGKRDDELDVREGAAAKDVLDALAARFPKLAGHKLHIAVDQEYASPATAVHSDNEIAVFTAVSGG
ncbi:MAG: molybdopterin synthase subunit MoaD / molybdopterin synthase subunit MoaE [Acidobacteria bacterium OLB17]|nr:MAG: molybdopterin synthase subunit MoaD / molybdopterin synthase subunit MoaE [Acidobacteria bacterium OLB17]MCZ2390134.1 MoaD/ThiS family protein [Acidobacteriota bacterium]